MKDRLLAVLLWACFGWLVALVLYAALAGAGESTMPGERPIAAKAGAALRGKCLAIGPGTCTNPGQFTAVADGYVLTQQTTAYSSANYPVIQSLRARGTKAAPLAVQTDDILGRFPETCGYDGTTFCGGFLLGDTEMRGVADGNFTSTSHPARIELWTTPSAATTAVKQLAIRQDGTTEFTKTVAKYNNIATVSNGVPAEYATIDTTGLTANVGSTLLYAVPSTGAGLYRVTALVVETTAASVSSTLANVQIVYTDNQTSGTITIDATPVLGVAGVGQTGALTANTVGTTSTGVIAVNAKASTNINYQTVNYASSTAGMTYALHIKLEAL